LLIGQEQAETLKLEIGSALEAVSVPDSAQVAGRDLVDGLLRRAIVGADQVRDALLRPLTQIVAATKDLLERAPPELSSDIAQRGLTLVGGGALLPGFAELLRRETQLTVTVDDEPLTTVARGAGLALDELRTLRPARGRRQNRTRR
jgi:rod shape-determining protein MreB and related proteins